MENKKSIIMEKITSGVGMILGIVFIKYIWVPLLLLILCFYIINRFVKNKNTLITQSIALQAGHLLWMISGTTVLYFFYGNTELTILPDIIILTIGLIWLLFKQGLIPIVCLTIYQLISIYINATTEIDVINLNCETSLIIAGLVHIIIRLISIILMIAGCIQIRKSKIESDNGNILYCEGDSINIKKNDMIYSSNLDKRPYTNENRNSGNKLWLWITAIIVVIGISIIIATSNISNSSNQSDSTIDDKKESSSYDSKSELNQKMDNLYEFIVDYESDLESINDELDSLKLKIENESDVDVQNQYKDDYKLKLDEYDSLYLEYENAFDQYDTWVKEYNKEN